MKKRLSFALGALFGNAWAETTDLPRRGRDRQAADQFNAGFLGESSNMEMVLINAYGDTMTRKINRVLECRRRRQIIITLIWPADVVRSSLGHKVGRDDQWLYLPTSKRVNDQFKKQVRRLMGASLPTSLGSQRSIP